MSVAVFASRILGLVREQVFAALFGAGRAMDAFVVAYRIPNLLRDLFAEGALSTAFVTVFSRQEQRLGLARTWRLANNVLAWLCLVVGAITLVGIFLAEPLVNLMAPAFGRIPGKLELTAQLTRIMFPFLLFVSLAALVMGVLNTRGKFFLPALAPSFYNLGSIIGGVSLTLAAPFFGWQPIVGMALGTLLGGFLQMAVQLPLLFRVGYRPQWVLDLKDEGLRQVLKLMVPAVVGLSATQINVFINTFYAARCMEGSVAWLNYAYRLVHLPQGLFGVALSVATLPLLSRCAAAHDLPALKGALASSLNLAMLVTIPAALGLMALSTPICAVIFEHGRFTAFDTAQTAQALIYYSLGLLAFAGVKIMVPAFYALNDTRLPVLGSFLTVAANFVCINLTLAALGHRAIALSTSLSMVVNLLFLGVMLHRKLAGLPLASLLRTLAQVTGAALLMAGAVYLAHGWLSAWMGPGLLARLMVLAACIILGLALYGLAVQALGVQAWRDLAQQMRLRSSGEQ
ncbi:MAG: murein biosynthesis integral membrane protein MurJ [Deltaproteobacteria bacterium]|nr:murein biosynthesis integral membrane protein MurJ [Deltaproteobacteria bacterium]